MKRILLFVLTLFLLTGMAAVTPSTALASVHTNGDPANSVPLSSIGMEMDTTLSGPFDSMEMQFSLPADWKLIPGAQLEINLSKYFSSLVVGQSSQTPQGLVAGNLNFAFNGVPLQTTLLQDNGDTTLVIPIPDDALVPDPLTGLYHLTFEWDATSSCDLNLATSVVIHPDSSLILPHSVEAMELDLAWWPAPIYLENSPDTSAVTLVIPDQATQKDLEVAMAVAAGLGRVSQNKLDLALTPISQLPSAKRSNDNLIMIGKMDSFAAFKDFKLTESGAKPGDGIIKMMVSPWNDIRVVVAVTGDSDEAVLKAGDALSSGTIISNSEKNTAIVEEIKPTAGEANLVEDIPLSKLTSEAITFETIGTSIKKFSFPIPSNVEIGADSYLDLMFNHSQLLDYLRSGMIIKINDLPMGSIRLSDATSGLNMIRLIVPPTIVHSGLNTLEIQVDLVSRTICTDQRVQSLWVTVFSDSVLHLPLEPQTLAQTPAENLGQYPWPLANELGQSVIVVPSNNPPSWYVAARLAYALGAQSGSQGFPAVLFADALPGGVLPEKNLLIIGSPANLPILAQLKGVLPGPFDANNELAAEIGARINYRIAADQTVGYLELAQSPAAGKTIYAVLGSNGEGVQRAGSALLTPAALKRLSSGNLAIIQGNKISVENIPTDQQAALAVPGEAAAPGEVGPVPAAEPLFKHEGWILPAVIVSLAFILLLIALEILVAIQRKNA